MVTSIAATQVRHDGLNDGGSDRSVGPPRLLFSGDNNRDGKSSPSGTELSVQTSGETTRGRSTRETSVARGPAGEEVSKSPPRNRSNSVLTGTMTKLKSMFVTENHLHHPGVGIAGNQESDNEGSILRKTSLSGQSHKPPARFQVSEDGMTHSHYLKQAKRQEKVGNLLRELLGGKKAPRDGQSPITDSSAAPPPPPQEQALSLLGTLVNQIKRGEKDGSTILAHASGVAANTLSQKYGKCHEVIGKGSFGIVRVAHKVDPRDNQREHLYAVKEFKKRPQESVQKYNKRLTSEFCISSSLHHPNIIQTLDLLQDEKGEYCEVMELCAGGDLFSLILSTGKLDYLEADCFFKQIIRGINYMHEMGVAHRDLKPENILLTAHGAIKITDFGNGECFRMAWEADIHLSNGLCGSAPYIAPEEFIEKEFDPRAVDIWAAGVIYMAMRTGRHLWRMAKADEDEYYEQYLQGRKDEKGYEPIESLKRIRCRNVIYSILDPVPCRRITGKQVLRSEWGREIVVCAAGEQGL